VTQPTAHGHGTRICIPHEILPAPPNPEHYSQPTALHPRSKAVPQTSPPTRSSPSSESLEIANFTSKILLKPTPRIVVLDLYQRHQTQPSFLTPRAVQGIQGPTDASIVNTPHRATSCQTRGAAASTGNSLCDRSSPDVVVCGLVQLHCVEDIVLPVFRHGISNGIALAQVGIVNTARAARAGVHFPGAMENTGRDETALFAHARQALTTLSTSPLQVCGNFTDFERGSYIPGQAASQARQRSAKPAKVPSPNRRHPRGQGDLNSAL